MKGFTLVETLVAITVLTFAILGPFHVAQTVLAASYIARDELIATTLSQEGIEYIREIRDSNFITNLHTSGSLPWLSGVDNTTGVDCYTHACLVDPSQATTPNAVIDCGNTTCAGQYVRLSTTNIYTHHATAGDSVTKFLRTVRLSTVASDPTQTMVTVTVTWNDHGMHSVTLQEVLRNWL